MKNHKKIVDLLLEKDFDINMVANDGTTALYIASQAGNKKLVEKLLEKKADTNIKDCNGYTALYIGTKNCISFIFTLIIN